MAENLEALDPEWVKEQLTRPPFVTISGISNVRTLGGYETSTPGARTRPNYVFRAAEVSGVTEEGVSWSRCPSGCLRSVHWRLHLLSILTVHAHIDTAVC